MIGGLIEVHVSSIVYVVIRTILSQFIFLWNDFECTKTQKREVNDLHPVRRFFLWKTVGFVV